MKGRDNIATRLQFHLRTCILSTKFCSDVFFIKYLDFLLIHSRVVEDHYIIKYLGGFYNAPT